MNNLLDIIPNSDKNWYFENPAESLIYALIGILIIFVGIILIIGVIWFVGFIMKKTDGFAFLTKKEQKVAVKVDKEQVRDNEEIPEHVRVAIVAALMAYYQKAKPKSEFTVKRIKRI